jgi:hypothetical protein
MRRASAVTVVERDGTKRFTAPESHQVMRSSNLVAITAFWLELEKLAEPEERTVFHARGVLHEIGNSALEDCRGFAYSPEQFDLPPVCVFEPLGIRPLGSTGTREHEL